MLNEYHNDIRRYIERNESRTHYGGDLTVYQIGIDEIYDPSKISQRFYGTRAHDDVVRIAAGTSFVHEPLPEKIILLPSLQVIIELQKKHEVINVK